MTENVVSGNAGLSNAHELAPGNSLSSRVDVDIVHHNGEAKWGDKTEEVKWLTNNHGDKTGSTC